VHEIVGVQFKEATIEIGAFAIVVRDVHDLDPEEDDWGRVVDYDVELERSSGADDPESLLDFFVVRALCGEAIEETFDVITSEHGVPVDGQMSIPYVGLARLFLGRPDALPL
jgi:hypothetical protein